MATMAEIMEGLKILSEHVDPNESQIEAQHDELYVQGGDPTMMSEEEVKRLNELGFFHQESVYWRVFT